MPKWLKLLVGICAGLLLLWGMSRLPRRAKPVLEMPASPVKIEIQRKDGLVVLVKTGERWDIVQPVPFPADADGVRFAIDALAALAVGERLSDRPENHGVYGVADASGTAVRVFGEGQAASAALVLGKAAPDGTHFYLRPAGKPDVYLAAGLRPADFDKPADQWRDRRLLRLAPGEELTRLTVARGKATVDLQKSSDAWTVNGRPADAAKINETAQRLRNFYSEGFIEAPEAADLKKWGLDKPALVFSIATSSQTQAEFRVGAKDPNAARRPVQRVGQDVLYWAPDYLVTSLPTAATEYFILSSSTSSAR